MKTDGIATRNRTGRATGYWPQLDGIRAVAIALVVAYHLGYLPGGWIGVDVFFVLSGYLITTKLLSGERIWGGLRTFWGRRARRLLPAVLVLLTVVSAYAWLDGSGVVPAQLRAPALATLLYTANWQQIIAGHSYFAKYTVVSPFQHTWSLAIEEQYYIIWPLILSGLLIATRPKGTFRQRRALIGATLGLAGLSAVWMGIAAHAFGPNRAYLGSDTRAWELLLGGAAAMLWPPAGERPPDRSRMWPAMALIGLLAVAGGALTVGGPPSWVWDGGLVGIGVGATALIVGSVREPASALSEILALRPLRWLGLISYSLYLWHWPVIVLMTTATTGLSGAALLAARLATMLVASASSYYAVERPLRRMDWSGLGRRIHVPAVSWAAAGIAVTALIIVGGTVGPRGAPSADVMVANVPVSTTVGGMAPHIAPPVPGQPYRTWIIGDSVMFDSSLGVQAALQATGDVSVVRNTSFPGWGLAADTTWPLEARQTITDYRPQIVMGTWSWDDSEAMKDPTLYIQRLEAAMRILLAPGNGVELVVLFQFPQAGPSSSITNPSTRLTAWTQETRAQDAWDNAASQAVKAFPGEAMYLSTDQLFAPDGSYYAWMKTPSGTWLRARKLDNVHFCPYGAAEFGALVTADLTPVLHLANLKSGWAVAAWTHDKRYNDPVGACPDDQPPPGYRGTPVPTG